MGWSAAIPGFRENATKWNLVVGAGYLVVGGLFLLFLPLVAAAAIGTDYRGLATRLSAVPGIAAGGGAGSALTAFLLVGIVWGVAAAPAPTDEVEAPTSNISTPTTSAAPSSSATAVDPHTASPTVPSTSTLATTATPEAGGTATPTARSATPPPATAAPTASPSQPSATATAGGQSDATSTMTAPPETDTATSQSTYRVTVTRVVDGDTLEIEYQNGSADTVRLLGVDTPEVHSETAPSEWEGVPDTEPARECLRRHGEQASDYAKTRLAGETVTLEFDAESDRRGYYDRLLAYVVHDGERVNERLLQRGLARYYESTFSEADAYEAMESDARAAQRSAWSCQSAGTATPTPTPTSSSGAGHDGVQIATIQADAPGDEYDNLNGEYIEIENAGSRSIELSGWTVREGDGVTYQFPDGFTLESGASVRVHTGSGSDSSSDLYWGQERPVWNNNGDTGTLRDATGEQVDTYTYG